MRGKWRCIAHEVMHSQASQPAFTTIDNASVAYVLLNDACNVWFLHAADRALAIHQVPLVTRGMPGDNGELV